MYVLVGDMKLMIEKYSNRDFAIIKQYNDENLIRHFVLEFADEFTDWYPIYQDIYFKYTTASLIEIVECENNA